MELISVRELFKNTAAYAGKTVEADRPNCFHHEAYCLLAPKGTKITLTAHSHSELYMQDTLNEKDYEPVMYLSLIHI